MMRNTIALAKLCLVGSAETSPIQLAATSKSHFAGAVYKGAFVATGSGTPGADAYRVFVLGARFVSIQSLRDDAEQRAKDGRQPPSVECKGAKRVGESTARIIHSRMYRSGTPSATAGVRLGSV
jgi:hypothetical protein